MLFSCTKMNKKIARVWRQRKRCTWYITIYDEARFLVGRMLSPFLPFYFLYFVFLSCVVCVRARACVCVCVCTCFFFFCSISTLWFQQVDEHFLQGPASAVQCAAHSRKFSVRIGELVAGANRERQRERENRVRTSRILPRTFLLAC